MTWNLWNGNPDAKDDCATTAYNTAVTINVLANDSDPNCDKLTISGSPSSSQGTVTVNADGTLTFTPNPGFSGTATIKYTISDGRGGYDTATVSVTVKAPVKDGVVEGTTGDDLIDTAYTGDPEGDRIDAGDYNCTDADKVVAGAGNDTVLAGAANDTVFGEAGNDLIDGGAGNDLLDGGAGDDTFIGGAGNDSFRGDTGLDIIDYSKSGSALNIDLSTGQLSGGDATGDQIISGIDGIIGSAYNDSLVGFDHEGTDPSDTYTNVLKGMGGNDTILGKGGDDSLYGGAGNDNIEGGAGNDYIEGDGDTGTPVAAKDLTIDWQKFKQDCGNLVNGSSYDMGGVKVTFGFAAQDSGATATSTTETQYVEAGDGLNAAGGLRLYGCGGEGGIDNTSTTTLTFAATSADYASAVTDVSFRINDVDVGTSSDYHKDIVTVRAYDANGNLLPVTYTVEGGQTVSGGTVTGQDVDSGTINTASAKGSVLVQVSGAVARIEIDYDNGGDTDQAVTVTDITASTVAAVDDSEGNDTLAGGDGDDTILGQGGDDLIAGGTGADSLSGGDDRDVIRAEAGDTVDGGAGGDDYDTLDITGLGDWRVVGQTPDSNGNGTNGTVEFLDADGNVTGTLGYTEIENILGDDVNHRPDAVNDTATVAEDSSKTIAVLGNDSDPDGDVLTVTSASAGHGTVTVNGDGTLTYTPEPDYNGPDTITYTVADPSGATDTATVAVTVTPVNDTPDAVDDSASTDFQTPVTVGVLANDSDPDGDLLSITSATSPDGSVTVNDDGTITFTPANGFEGEARISYSVSDGMGGTDTATLTVLVGEDPRDGIVEGTTGADLIDTAYTGDPEGDLVDAGDAILPGDAPDDDRIEAGAGSDTVLAGLGDDTVAAGTGDDVVDGGAGDDSLQGNEGRDTLRGGEGSDTIDGGDDNDLVDGGLGDDSLLGGLGNDTLRGMDGNDTVRGDLGNDSIVTGTGNDLADGGEGDDYINTRNEAAAPDLGYPGLYPADANPTDDLDTVFGGAGNDTILTGDDRDYIDAGTGHDVIDAGVDEDTILAGEGDDRVTAGEGDDLVDGGAGNDTIYGGLGPNVPDAINIPDATDLVQDNGRDTIHGGDGDDVIYGEDDDDEIYGDAGNDYIDGGIDEDTILGGTGNDTVLGGAGADSLSGEDDRDTFVVASATAGAGDVIDGGEGGDDYDTLDLTGAGPVNVVYDPTNPENGTVNFLDGDGNVLGTLDFTNIERIITDGDGIVEGTDGADLIDYDYTGDPEGDRIDHNDALIAGDAPQDDRVEAGAGNDTILSGLGNDTVAAGAGNDAAYGGDGDDSLVGEAGNDTLDGGIGNDTLLGGAGQDEALGGDGDDVIDTSNGSYAPDRGYPGLFPGDTDPTDDLDTVFGGAGNDSITTGDDNDFIDAGTGNDTVDAGVDDDTVLGGDGNDLITGGEGSDSIEAGAGDDTVYAGLPPTYPDGLNIPDATDLVPDNGLDTVHGGDGNDVIYGADDDDVLYGDAGNDYIDGGIDEDTLSGGEGDDTLIGGQGDDWLTGGAGADSLSGGADRDSFVIELAANGVGDVIDGNEEGNDYDTLDLQGAGPFRVIYDPNNSENGTVNFLDDEGNITGSLAFRNIENVIPCFTPGTMIATPRGERRVEDLREGDKILTRDNGIQEIRWVGRRDMTRADLLAAPHLCPVLIRAGSLGNGLPERDMLVSPNHRMLVANERTALYFEEHEVLVAAKHLVDNRGIRSVETLGTSYLHFLFDRHEVVLANGAWTESFQPGDQTLGGMGNAQRAEIFELFPDLKTREGVEGYTAARKTLKKHEAALLRG